MGLSRKSYYALWESRRERMEEGGVRVVSQWWDLEAQHKSKHITHRRSQFFRRHRTRGKPGVDNSSPDSRTTPSRQDRHDAPGITYGTG